MKKPEYENGITLKESCKSFTEKRINKRRKNE